MVQQCLREVSKCRNCNTPLGVESACCSVARSLDRSTFVRLGLLDQDRLLRGGTGVDDGRLTRPRRRLTCEWHIGPTKQSTWRETVSRLPAWWLRRPYATRLLVLRYAETSVQWEGHYI
jgi:hypothetical protein